MEFFLVVGVLAAIVSVAVVIQYGRGAADGTRFAERLFAVPNFTPSEIMIGVDVETAVALDTGRRKIGLFTRTSHRVVDYAALVSVELYEDGHIVTDTVRSSQLAGAAIGQLLHGDTGAIIGGLSARTESRSAISRIDLRLTINDPKRPLHDVAFLRQSAFKTDPLYLTALYQARHWHAVLMQAVRNGPQASAMARPRAPAGEHSVADELRKLADLRADGVLTADEFNRQKSRLLVDR